MTDTNSGVRALLNDKLGRVREFLNRPGVFEVVLNEPGEVFVETARGWVRELAPELTLERLMALAGIVASYSGQSISASHPLLSAALPDGERVQFCIPPAVAMGQVSMTIRKPGQAAWALEDLAARGLFSEILAVSAEGEDYLQRLRTAGNYVEFFRQAVRSRKTVLISGGMGSGKTTLSKSLILEFGRDERIVTIEDTPEFVVACPNWVSLRYSKGGQGISKIGARDLLEAALRMRPDRFGFQELRDDAAYDYLRAVNAGHPGSITTIHGNSCRSAFEQVVLLVKQSGAGATLERVDVLNLLRMTIDIVVQCNRVGPNFRVSEVLFGREVVSQALAS
jgi:type IV secretion system protein VirB11